MLAIGPNEPNEQRDRAIARINYAYETVPGLKQNLIRFRELRVSVLCI